jgi:hypothetical protein
MILSTFDVLSSLNYFTYICPECFQDDDFYSNALDFLDFCCDVPLRFGYKEYSSKSKKELII